MKLKPLDRLSTEPIIVQDFLPESLNHLTFYTHLYDCGMHLWIKGLVPGATLQIGEEGHLGIARSIHGEARLTLNAPIAPGQRLEALQVIKQGDTLLASGSVVRSPSPTAPPTIGVDIKQLFPPVVHSPVFECERSILVSNVVEGGNIRLFRDGGVFSDGIPFDQSSHRVSIKAPTLNEGEELFAEQFLVGCDIDDSSPSVPPLVVQPAEDSPPPRIVSPIWENDNYIVISDLSPGAKVVIYQDSNIVIGQGESPDTSFRFSVSTLVANSTITAKQISCSDGRHVSISQPVEVTPVGLRDSHPHVRTKARILPNSLFECATIVSVDEIAAGSALVTVYSRKLGQISNTVFVQGLKAKDGIANVEVSPALLPGDEITVKVARGSEIETPEPQIVQALPNPLPLPKINSTQISGTSEIFVFDVIVGAIVEVYVNGKFSSYGIAKKIRTYPTPAVWIKTARPLEIGDTVFARQRICEEISEYDPELEMTVVRPLPLTPKILAPMNGVKADKEVTLYWEDPGKGNDYAADSYYIETRTDNSTTGPLKAFSTSSLTWAKETWDYSQEVFWKVQSINSAGRSSFSIVGSFTVKDDPDKQTSPQQSSPEEKEPDVSQFKKGVKRLEFYNCHSQEYTALVWVNEVYQDESSKKWKVTGWNQVGTIPSHYLLGRCPNQYAPPYAIDFKDNHYYYVHIAYKENPMCDYETNPPSKRQPPPIGCTPWQAQLLGDSKGVTLRKTITYGTR